MLKFLVSDVEDWAVKFGLSFLWYVIYRISGV